MMDEFRLDDLDALGGYIFASTTPATLAAIAKLPRAPSATP